MARNTEADNPLRLFPSEQPLQVPTPLPSIAPSRRLVPARRQTIVRGLLRSGLAAPVALHAALRRGLVPEMLGLLVIVLLAGNLADRESAPAAPAPYPAIQSAGTGALSVTAASHTPPPGNMPPAPARVEPSTPAEAHAAPPPAAPRPSELRPRNAANRNSVVPASQRRDPAHEPRRPLQPIPQVPLGTHLQRRRDFEVTW